MVEENKRQLCVHKVASDAGKPWLWWQYASLFATHCRMHSQRFNDACAEEQVQETGLDYSAVQDCMGDSHADADHPLMEVSALEASLAGVAEVDACARHPSTRPWTLRPSGSA